MNAQPSGALTPSSPLRMSLTKLLEEELKLCKLDPNERLVVWADSLSDKRFVDAWCSAANNLGAEYIDIGSRLPYTSINTTKRGLLFNVLKQSNMIINMLSRHVFAWAGLYSDFHNELLRSGVRSLMCWPEEERLRRLFPNEEVIERTYKFAKLLKNAQKIRVYSESGTDLILSKKGRKSTAQVGVADIPGRWDNFGSGTVGFAPLEDSANGTIVIDTCDVLRMYPRFVSEPVKLTLENGKVIKIEGQGIDAILLKQWFAMWKDKEIYGIAHVNIGTDHRALWNLISGMDWESYLGCVIFDFGINIFDTPTEYCGLGGTNRSKGHGGISLRNCDFYADDEQILKAEKIIHPNLK